MPGGDLAKIKRLILLGRYRFTRKAELERLRDGLSQTDVLEAIISANGIEKVFAPEALSGLAAEKSSTLLRGLPSTDY